MLPVGNLGGAVVVFHDGRHSELAAVGWSPLVPNWFFTVVLAGSLRAVGLIAQHAKCPLAFVIGDVTECPAETTVFRVGSQCICNAPTTATEPPGEKAFRTDTLLGTAENGAGIFAVFTLDAE